MHIRYHVQAERILEDRFKSKNEENQLSRPGSRRFEAGGIKYRFDDLRNSFWTFIIRPWNNLQCWLINSKVGMETEIIWATLAELGYQKLLATMLLSRWWWVRKSLKPRKLTTEQSPREIKNQPPMSLQSSEVSLHLSSNCQEQTKNEQEIKDYNGIQIKLRHWGYHRVWRKAGGGKQLSVWGKPGLVSWFHVQKSTWDHL